MIALAFWIVVMFIIVPYILAGLLWLVFQKWFWVTVGCLILLWLILIAQFAH